MRVTIIGGGNMGSSLVTGLLTGTFFKEEDITVVDVQKSVLEQLKKKVPGVKTVVSNYDSVTDADMVIMAVKPWMIQDVILDIKFKLDYEKQLLISVAAGVTIEEMNKSLVKPVESRSLPVLFRVIPNTAIKIAESMTLISSNNASSEQEQLVLNIFDELGKAILIDEERMKDGTALTSCGIAYLFRYIRAAMEAGIEMGFYPKDAQTLVVHTMKGAAELLLRSESHPEAEIDLVTTPGGLTIKGLNELEANGFSNAVIKGIKAGR